MGILCALVWSYTLTAPADLAVPEFHDWPLLLTIGVLAALAEFAYILVTRRLAAATGSRSRAWLSELTQIAMLLLMGSAVLFVLPVVMIGVAVRATVGISEAVALRGWPDRVLAAAVHRGRDLHDIRSQTLPRAGRHPASVALPQPSLSLNGQQPATPNAACQPRKPLCHPEQRACERREGSPIPD